MTAIITLPASVEPVELARLAGADVSTTDWGYLSGDQLTVFGVDQAALEDALAAYDQAAIDAARYRLYRAAAYRDQLGAEQGDFIKTLGDVIDVIVKELRARGEAAHPEFAAMVAEIDSIKAEFPKPE